MRIFPIKGLRNIIFPGEISNYYDKSDFRFMGTANWNEYFTD